MKNEPNHCVWISLEPETQTVLSRTKRYSEWTALSRIVLRAARSAPTQFIAELKRSAKFMTIFLLLLIGIVAALSLPAIVLIQKNAKARIWDWCFPFSGILMWLILLSYDVGATISGANFIEPVWIGFGSIAVAWIYFFILKTSFMRNALIRYSFTFLPIFISIAIRLFTPMLPE